MNQDKAKLKPLAALFVAFPRQEREGTEDGLLDVYLLAAEDISADFVAMACKRFVQGQVEGASVTWRPSPAELAAEARRLRSKAAENAWDQKRLAGPQRVPERKRLAGPRPPFTPYPKLWDALAGSPDLIKALDGMTFDGMTQMSKLFATEGLEAVRTKLAQIAAAPNRERAA